MKAFNKREKAFRSYCYLNGDRDSEMTKIAICLQHRIWPQALEYSTANVYAQMTLVLVSSKLKIKSKRLNSLQFLARSAGKMQLKVDTKQLGIAKKHDSCQTYLGRRLLAELVGDKCRFCKFNGRMS